MPGGKDQPIGEFRIAPDPQATGLTRQLTGSTHSGETVSIAVIEERPLTIFLNSTEILTAMTIGDYPEFLALGFLANQGMLDDMRQVTGVDYDAESDAVVVRTVDKTGHEEKLRKKTRTSGCAVGTVFGDLYESVESVKLPDTKLRVSWLYSLAATINRTPSLYLEAGAIHGTVLCHQDLPLVYMEDVGRHNAVDKVAGWMLVNEVNGSDKILYTTGRLTTEMIIKTAMMGIPVLASRSGFTAWGVDIARKVGLTLIGRLRGRRFMCLAGGERLIRDADYRNMQDEDRRHRRKAAGDD
ncbi:MAG: formate dehydrogenase accessory sulfurtransferase FdhD [Rhodobacteraceae bacterium]|nr:formate dehydrogenase accessory sulfurtransferase FdhD [Paracoccaceae bacterium]